jgi:hypothetical protein
MCRLCDPNGISLSASQTANVNPGNRSACVSTLSLFAVLVASNAGRLGEDGAGSMWLATDLAPLVEPEFSPRTCREDALRPTELRFEKIRSDADIDRPRSSPSEDDRIVRFQWNPKTGELWFDTRAASTQIKLPEGRATATSTSLPTAFYQADPGCE